MTKSPVKNGRATPAKRGGVSGQGELPANPPPAAQQQAYRPDELVPESEIEIARLRARNATLEAEFIAMRNELIKVKTELQRRIDGEGQSGKANGNNKARPPRKNGGRSKADKS